jgi:hypothetical protein
MPTLSAEATAAGVVVAAGVVEVVGADSCPQAARTQAKARGSKGRRDRDIRSSERKRACENDARLI